jgi:hypothetical protein
MLLYMIALLRLPHRFRRRARRSPAGLAERAQVVGEDIGGGQGAGVVLAQDAAEPGQGVFGPVPGRLVIAERAQVNGEAVGGVQGVGVVLAQDASVPGQGVLVRGCRISPTRTSSTRTTLTRANFTDATWPDGTQFPGGWIAASNPGLWPL